MSTNTDNTEGNGEAGELANPEMAAAVEQDSKERKQKRQEELTEAEREKEQLLDAVLGDTFHIRVKAKRMEVTPLDGEEEDFIEGSVLQFVGIDEEEMTPDQRDDYLAAQERIPQLLAEHTTDETWDREFWKRMPNRVRQEALADIRNGGEESEQAGN